MVASYVPILPVYDSLVRYPYRQFTLSSSLPFLESSKLLESYNLLQLRNQTSCSLGYLHFPKNLMFRRIVCKD